VVKIQKLPGPRAIATAPVRDTSTRPKVPSTRQTRSAARLSRSSRNTKLSVVESITRARKTSGEAQRLDAGLALAGDLDQRKFALNERAFVGQIVDLAHRHQA